jgi:hypothetical protein
VVKRCPSPVPVPCLLKRVVLPCFYSLDTFPKATWYTWQQNRIGVREDSWPLAQLWTRSGQCNGMSGDSAALRDWSLQTHWGMTAGAVRVLDLSSSNGQWSVAFGVRKSWPWALPYSLCMTFNWLFNSGELLCCLSHGRAISYNVCWHSKMQAIPHYFYPLPCEEMIMIWIEQRNAVITSDSGPMRVH